MITLCLVFSVKGKLTEEERIGTFQLKQRIELFLLQDDDLLLCIYQRLQMQCFLLPCHNQAIRQATGIS